MTPTPCKQGYTLATMNLTGSKTPTASNWATLIGSKHIINAVGVARETTIVLEHNEVL